MNRTIVLISIFILIIGYSFTQENNTAENFFNKRRLFELYDKENNDCFVIESDKSNIFSDKLQLVYSRDREENASGKISLVVPNGRGNLIHASRYNGNIIVVLFKQIGDSSRSYYQVYDKYCKPVSKLLLICEYVGKNSNSEMMKCLSSDDGRFLCVEYRDYGADQDNIHLQYTILDSHDESTKSGSGTIPFSEYSVNSLDKKLTTNGLYLVGFPIYERSEGLVYEKKCSKYVIYQNVNGSLVRDEIPLNNLGLEFINLQLEKDGNAFYVFGIHFDKSSGFGSVVSVKYDLETRQEIERGESLLGFNLRACKFRRKLVCDDNSVIFLFEQSFGGHSTVMATSSGTVSTTPKDYLGNIVCFKISKGNIVWEVPIYKHQVFLYDGDLLKYGSFKSYQEGNDLFLFFNDNIQNYNEKNECILIKERGVKSMKLFSINTKMIGKLGVAKVKIDLLSGEFQRKLVVKQKGIVPFTDSNTFTSGPDEVVLTLNNGEKIQVKE